MTPVQFLASKFPGKSEQEYRQHLGNFQISGMTGLQLIGTLSGGQKSRVAFSALSLQQPHVLLLDEVRWYVAERSTIDNVIQSAYKSLGYRGGRLWDRHIDPCADRDYVKGLDALMLALKTWNGGVIVISHDERFITTVANEVCLGIRGWLLGVDFNNSCGSVEMVRSASLEVTFRCTRSAFGPSYSWYCNC